MQKITILLVALIAGTTLHAQNFAARPAQPGFGFKPKMAQLPPYRPYYLPGDAVYLNNQPGAAANNSGNVDGMPVKNLGGQLNLVYTGVGANGNRIYTATPNFMPVIKPAQNFYSPMPVINPAANGQVPNNFMPKP